MTTAVESAFVVVFHERASVVQHLKRWHKHLHHLDHLDQSLI